MLGASKAGLLGAAGGDSTLDVVWQSGLTNYTRSTTTRPDDTLTLSGASNWSWIGLVDYGITSGKWSIDLEVIVSASPSRLIVGVSVSNASGGTNNYMSNGENNSTYRGIDVSGTVGSIKTIEFDYSTGVVEVFQDGVSVANRTATVGGQTWYFAVQEYEDNPAWKLVPQVYAPTAGYTKINP